MKNGGQIPWNAKPICETFKISCLTGRLHTKDVLENLLKDQSFRLVHWLSITLFLRKTSQESINLERKSYVDCSLDTLCTRGEFGRVTQWLQTLRSWTRWTLRKSIQKKIQCKGSNISQRKWKIHISSRRWTNFQRDFLGESEGSPPSPAQDSYPDAGEGRNDFWSMSGNFIYRHHVEPRVKLYSPREESFPSPLKYIHVSRTTHTNLDVMQESFIDDYWNVDGSRDLSDSWTGFTLLD